MRRRCFCVVAMRLRPKPRFPALIWLIILLGLFLVVPALSQGQLRSSAMNLVTGQKELSLKGPLVKVISAVQSVAPLVSANSPASASPTSTAPLTYHGGPVQQVQYAYAIFWLPAGYHYDINDSQFEVLISQYFNDVGGSNFSKLLVQYPDDVNASPTGSLIFGGGFVDTTPYPEPGTVASPLLGQDIANEVQKIISSGSLPTGKDDAYYVFTASGINVCEDQGMTMCTFNTPQQTGFCAYHSYVQSDNYVPYALLSVDPSGITGGCQISEPIFPYNDPIADSEISLVSQEQFALQTDPLGSAWYDATTASEIDNQCAGQFGLVNSTDGANVILHDHEYILQEEWSNAAGGCTLVPPHTTSVQVILQPYGTSNALTVTNYFPLSYAIGRQLFTVHYVTGAMTIQADPNTSLSIGPFSSSSNTGSEEWCLDASCQGEVVYLSTASLKIGPLNYYDILKQNVYEATSDNSAPSAFASITYVTAPSSITAGSSDVDLSLSDTSRYIWVLRGTTATVSSETYLASPTTERWTNPEASWSVSQPFQIPPVISYHQYLVDFGYSVIPTGKTISTGPTVTYVNSGMTNTTVAPNQVWADAGSSYSYSNTLGSSTSSERWESLPGSGDGKVTFSATVGNSYYNQFPITVSYHIPGSNGSNSNPPTFTGSSFGSNLTFPLDISSRTYWLDANSTYSVTNLLPGSNSTDRWISISNNTGVIASPKSLNLTFYHQFALNFSYAVSGGGVPPSLPVVNYTSFNGTASYRLSNISSAVWVNAGTALNVSASMVSPNSTERWAYSSVSGVASEPGKFQITLYHQFEVGFSVVILGGGSPTALPAINGVAFGHSVSIQAKTVVNSTSAANTTRPVQYVWLDAGSSYSMPSSLGSSSSERWLTSSAPFGIVNSTFTISVTYYNQYPITLEYTVTNGADPSGGPSASVVLFGDTESISVNQTSGRVWADAGTTVSLPSDLPGSNSGEEWATNSTVRGTVTSALSLTPTYNHQFMVTLDISPTGIPVVLSQQSGWNNPGTNLDVTLISPRGWNFEGWSGQGIGAYTGSSSSLILTVTAPITETANFYAALTITAPSTGSVKYSFGNVTGTVGLGQSKIVYVPPGQLLSMSADPFPVFYAFSSWTGNISGGPNATVAVTNPLTFSVNSPAALKVAFKINVIGIMIVAVVVIVAIASVLMLRRRNRPHEEGYSEESSDESALETLEDSNT